MGQPPSSGSLLDCQDGTWPITEKHTMAGLDTRSLHRAVMAKALRAGADTIVPDVALLIHPGMAMSRHG